MVNYMEELSVTEADNLKKTIAALFRQTCILQMKYDPVTLVPRDNLHYEICTRHRKFIEDYLSVLNCELVHEKGRGYVPEAFYGVLFQHGTRL